MTIEFGAYPSSEKGTVSDDYFGTEIKDPYRWMELDTSAEVKDWVKRQNEFTNAFLEQIPFRANLEKRLSTLYNYPKYGAPFHIGDRLFFYKNDGLQDQSVLYVQEPGAEAKVFIDPNKLSKDGTTALSSLSASNDDRYLAYTKSSVGSDWKVMRIRDLETGDEFEEEIGRIKFGSAAWAGNGFFYSAYDEPEKGMEYIAATVSPKIYYHKLGSSQADDSLVYENTKEKQRYYWPSTPKNEKFLFIGESQGTHGNQMWFKPLDDPMAELKLLFKGFEFDYSIVAVVGELAYVHTNDGADNYKLCTIDLGLDDLVLRDLIPQGDRVMTGVSLVDNRLFVHYLKDAASQIVEFGLDGSKQAEIELPGIGQVNGFGGKRDAKELYYTFTSYINPATVYKYETQSRKSTLHFDPEFPLDLDQFESKRVWYTSKDGTKIPMVLTHKKGIMTDGNNPTLLYGYGGFNISIRPGFKVDRMVFLENGGILAVANLRGGGEYGEEWHRAGMLEKKQNVFDDFIAAAEFLIEEKYTSSDKLAIEGRSNGGLLVGACMLQRPELFKVALPTVGVLDMLRYHKFTVGWGWAVEYGSSDEKEQFDYLIKYSPLHNVKDAEFPATLVLTGDHDDRVVPAHSFKFAATLQDHQQGDLPVMIRIEENAGHGAGKPISKRVEENADIWSFVMYHLGMDLKE